MIKLVLLRFAIFRALREMILDIFQQVMRVLLRNHGANLSGVKSDLYTTIGQSLVSEGLYISFIIFYLQGSTANTQVESLLQYVWSPSKLSGVNAFVSGLEKHFNFV